MGMVSYINYKDINDVVKGINENNLCDGGLIVTASADMRLSLCDVLKKNKDEIASINSISDKLFKSWGKPGSSFDQYIYLSEIIDKHEVSIKDKYFSAFKKNKKEVLLSIRTLLELGIMPSNLVAKTEIEKVFVNIYKEFIDSSKNIKAFLHNVGKLNNPASFVKSLKEAEICVNCFEKIYFQGFVYITPLQWRIIEAFKRVCKNVYFLNNYDSDVSEAYKIWEVNHDYKDKQIFNIPSIEDRTKKFSEVFLGGNKKFDISGVNIIEFTNVFSFVKHIDDIKKENFYVITPDMGETNKIFDTYFPERDEKKRLLAYPVGQYLISLYEMWDQELQKVICLTDNIKKCISTGWAGRKIEGTSRALETFDKVAAYFIDCKTLQDWMNRIELLREVKKQVLPLFETEHNGNRWPLVLGNPLMNIGAFSISEKELEEMVEIIGDIFEDVELLFSKKEDVDVAHHFNELLRVIDSKELVGKARSEELLIVKQVIERIKNYSIDTEKCSLNNLAEAMGFILSGEADEEPEDSGRLRLVNRMDSIEAISLREKVNLYLCPCDEKHIPGAKGELSWPLTDTLLKKASGIEKSIVDNVNHYICNIENRMLLNRYFFYKAVQIEGLNIAWFAEYDGKPVSKSPYVNILNILYGLEILKQDGMLLQPSEEEVDSNIELSEVKMFVPDDLKGNKELGEFSINKKLCSYRNFYDYGLQHHPYFADQYHMKFFVTGLLATIFSGETRRGELEKSAEEVFRILPMYNDSEKNQVVSFAKMKRFNLDGNREEVNFYGGRQYQPERLYLKYFHQLKDLGSVHINQKCTFCPNRDSCYFAHRGDSNG